MLVARSSQPLDLGARLLARGFQPGWKPCWMALDLHAIQTDHPRPADLSVFASSAAASAKGLPYSNPNDASAGQDASEQFPHRMRRFAAALNGKVVGHSAVVLSEGPYGVAGIANVGVVPEARNRESGRLSRSRPACSPGRAAIERHPQRDGPPHVRAAWFPVDRRRLHMVAEHSRLAANLPDAGPDRSGGSDRPGRCSRAGKPSRQVQRREPAGADDQ